MARGKRRSSGRVKKPVRPCTYELGYVRQDLYACRKCTKVAGGVHAGFCRGCRETCHADHDDQVFELYTKRAFRCDCGNSRSGSTCVLFAQKDDLNVGNEQTYGHNFESRYCRCDKEYDPLREMAQCAMCEDWFHEDCCKTGTGERAQVPQDCDYELICRDCVAKLPVLAEYYDLLNTWKVDGAFWRNSRQKRGECVRPRDRVSSIKPGMVDTLWRPGFRLRLCRCKDCMELYQASQVLYIVDRTDFVGGADLDDPDVLEDTDDAAIADDVVADAEDGDLEKETRQRETLDDVRIPRKPVPPPRPPPPPADPSVSPRLDVRSVQSIRQRINAFLRDSIETNGGSLSRESVLAYMTDLKADLLATFKEKLNDEKS